MKIKALSDWINASLFGEPPTSVGPAQEQSNPFWHWLTAGLFWEIVGIVIMGVVWENLAVFRYQTEHPVYIGLTVVGLTMTAGGRITVWALGGGPSKSDLPSRIKTAFNYSLMLSMAFPCLLAVYLLLLSFTNPNGIGYLLIIAAYTVIIAIPFNFLFYGTACCCKPKPYKEVGLSD